MTNSKLMVRRTNKSVAMATDGVSAAAVDTSIRNSSTKGFRPQNVSSLSDNKRGSTYQNSK